VDAHRHDDAATLRRTICHLEDRQLRRRAHLEVLAELIAQHDGQ
jgi:hypothetical protein